MTKLKSPLFSFEGHGKLGDIVLRHRDSLDIAEKKPEVKDAQSAGQLSWRTMFEKCALMWHALSAVEKAAWEAAARPLHMTGYAFWQSQCLRPNPGIYLPLAGGTMTGEIAMSTKKITGMGDPAAAQDADTKTARDIAITTALYTQGCRVRNTAAQSISDSTWTPITFDTEQYDTDGIHSTASNTNRLTCKTPGVYIISGCLEFVPNNAGERYITLWWKGSNLMAGISLVPAVTGSAFATVTTLYQLALNDWLDLRAWQNSGGALNTIAAAYYTPSLGMQRVS